MNLKVLHIWNTAGVASILAKFQNRIFGWSSYVITRRKYDRFGLLTYGDYSMLPSELFVMKVLVLLVPKYNIIHVHSQQQLLPLIKRMFPRKPIIMHYHGSEIRGKWHINQRYWKYADAIIVSTPDLLKGAPKQVIYLPNPVDTDLFRPMPSYRISNDIGVFIHRGYTDLEEAIRRVNELSQNIGIRIFIYDSTKHPIPYRYMPFFLNRFEYFVDRWWIKSLSKTALEALACGLKVIRWDGKIVKDLPIEHKPEYVISRLARIYYMVIRRYSKR